MRMEMCAYANKSRHIFLNASIDGVVNILMSSLNEAIVYGRRLICHLCQCHSFVLMGMNKQH